MFFHITNLTFLQQVSRELQSHRKLQILTKVILLMIVYCMKEAGARGQLEAVFQAEREKKKRRGVEVVLSSYVLAMTRMKHRASRGARRPKAKRRRSLHLNSTSCRKLYYYPIESEKVYQYGIGHFDTMVNLSCKLLTCLTRSFEVVCTGTTGFSNSEIGFRPRQKRSSFCSSFLPTESTVLENHLCMLCLHYCDYLHVI